MRRAVRTVEAAALFEILFTAGRQELQPEAAFASALSSQIKK